jgi:hypothetical protein
MTLEPGLRAAFRHTVTEADTAAAIGSGEVPVLATPRVLALAERATVPRSPAHSKRGRPRSVSGSSWTIWPPVWSGPTWRSRRCWSGWTAGGWSSTSASAMATGPWPAA